MPYASVLMEIQNQQPVATYTYGDDLISYHQGNGSQYYLYDGLGSTRGLTNSSGQLTDQYSYDAYGQTTDHTGTSNNKYEYAGEQKDITGNYYLRARYYNPSIGRFSQMDTYMGQNGNPITLHKYLYANASPTMYTDPSGHFGLASISGFGLNFGMQNMVRYGSSSLAKQGLKQFLFGKPPKDLGIIGEYVLDFAVQSVIDTMLFEGKDFSNKGASGTSAHKGLEERIKNYQPLPNYRLLPEVYYPSGRNVAHTFNNSAGSLGVDVMIQHQTNGIWKNVLGFDLKIGKGWSKSTVADRMKRTGADIVQIRIKVTGK